MSWTDERVELLKKLWGEGLSASQVAAQLGGVTRNAVIGKVHRLKLSGRVRTAKPVARTRKTETTAATRVSASPSVIPASAVSSARTMAASAPRTVGAAVLKMEFVADAVTELKVRPVEDVVIPMSRRLNLLQLTENTCKWPIGDPMAEDFYFCGAEAGEESPYCAHHSSLAFQQVGDRRRAKAQR